MTFLELQPVECEDCEGWGRVPVVYNYAAANAETCPTCDGSGVVEPTPEQLQDTADELLGDHERNER